MDSRQAASDDSRVTDERRSLAAGRKLLHESQSELCSRVSKVNE